MTTNKRTDLKRGVKYCVLLATGMLMGASNAAQADPSVTCSIISDTCSPGTIDTYTAVCTNNGDMDETHMQLSLVNKPTASMHCGFNDQTDMTFSNRDSHTCTSPCFFTGAGPISGGSDCLLTSDILTGLTVRAGKTEKFAFEHNCPPVSTDLNCQQYTDPNDLQCCVCHQMLQNTSCSAAAFAVPGERACLEVEWSTFTTNGTDLGCKTITTSAPDGRPVFPPITVTPDVATVPSDDSIELTYDVTNPADGTLQFEFQLFSVNPDDVPVLFAVTALSGVASSSGNGTPSVEGLLEPIPPGETLAVLVRVAGPGGDNFQVNEIFLEAKDPEAALGVPVSALVFAEPPTGPPIPTVSAWSLVILTLLGMTIGVIIFARRRTAAC